MQENGKKSLFFILTLSVLSAGIFSVGFYFGKSKVKCEVCPPQDLNFSLFWETYQKLRDKYVDPKKIIEQEVVYGAISGMVKSLGDPYTIFLDPEDTEKFLDDISGSFEGVGMEVGIKNNYLQVIAPLEGTPAQRAGLRAGDRILEIDGMLTTNLSLNEVVSMIRGPKGTKVALTIFREGWEVAKSIEVERGVIEIPSLRWEITEGNIAYIRLYHFTEKASLDFNQAAVKILASSADRIILDLRNNPGGYLEVAKSIAGFFLERGEVVVIEDLGEERKEHRAQGNSVFLDYPIVVLINKGSASGSEILAGALRDNRGIGLIGENSFGKGSVQQLEILSKGSSLKVTVAHWLTPKGETISEIGLRPDITVEVSDEDREANRDPQLEKAIEVIKEL